MEDIFDENFYNDDVTWSTPPTVPHFLTPKIDIDINPDLFIGWLSFEDDNHDSEKDYAYNVQSNCEYSCLFVAMLLYDKPLKGELKIICGNYGFWGHYWLKYTIDGESYYIDLTLQQFLPNAPKISICKAIECPKGYNTLNPEGESIRDYVDRKRAFEFYNDPNCF